MQRLLFGYFSKEDKSVDEEKTSLDLGDLKKYISKKYSYAEETDFIKSFSTPLDIGKYCLALHLETLIAQQIKAVDVIHYENVRRILFIGYKVNEFLEQPDLYANSSTPITSVLCSRKTNMTGVVKAAEKYVADYGVEYSVESFSQVEIRQLFREFEKRFLNITPPLQLPKSLKTGSGVIGRTLGLTSSLHAIIYDLYNHLPDSEEELSYSLAAS